MVTAWLVEQGRETSESLVRVLSSNLPLRLVATPQSLVKLLAICEPQALPQVVILNDFSMNRPFEVMAVLHALKAYESKTRVLIAQTSAKAWLDLAQDDVLMWSLDDVTGLLTRIQSSIGGRTQADSRTVAQGVKESKTTLEFGTVTVGDVRYDRLKSSLVIGDTDQKNSQESLSPKEARILETLLERLGQCVTRQEISNLVWPGIYVSDRTLDSHVSRIRRKLQSSLECKIDAVYGKGYCLRVGDSLDSFT